MSAGIITNVAIIHCFQNSPLYCPDHTASSPDVGGPGLGGRKAAYLAPKKDNFSLFRWENLIAKSTLRR
jgi:hypothetical protein